jgi:hypothetical protein
MLQMAHVSLRSELRLLRVGAGSDDACGAATTFGRASSVTRITAGWWRLPIARSSSWTRDYCPFGLSSSDVPLADGSIPTV